MREIIFRGKSVDSKEWIFGDYYYGEFVISETVGQYTGLKDKNGKMIFEGDVVRMYDTERLTFQVNYNDRKCGFYVGADQLLASDCGDIEVINAVLHPPSEVWEGGARQFAVVSKGS